MQLTRSTNDNFGFQAVVMSLMFSFFLSRLSCSLTGVFQYRLHNGSIVAESHGLQLHLAYSYSNLSINDLPISLFLKPVS